MSKDLIKTMVAAAGIALLPALSSAAAPPSAHTIHLTQDPVVMRLSRDEFRIAFGINAERCASQGCNGVIRYRVDWKTEDGTVHSETKHVSYNVLPHTSRTMTVDRQYFDTAEGAHKTDIVKVRVDMITCAAGTYSHSSETASALGHR
jgi:hypothetical protein